MKKITLFLFTICRLALFAQPCSTPVSNGNFGIIRSQVLGAPNSAQALQKGMEAARNHCFSSSQARELVQLYLQDTYKTEIAKALYPSVIDKFNFQVVYEIFTNAPALAALAGFVNDYNIQQSNDSKTSFDRSEIALPVYEKNNGSRIAGQQPMDYNTFSGWLQNNNHPDPQQRLQNLLHTKPAGYFSAAQVMEAAMLFPDENMRLSILKQLTTKILDLSNYPYALQLLSTLSNKKNYLEYVQVNLHTSDQGGHQNGGKAACLQAVSDAEANIIKGSLERISLSSTRAKQYKAVLKNKCLTSTQIKMLVTLFSNTDRLSLLAYSYDHCVDVQNFFALSEILVYNSDVEAFSEFLQAK